MSFDSNLFCERANELFGNRKQEELAKNIGLSQGVISAIRNYKSKASASDTVFKIANKYNVSADWLLGLNDFPIPCKDLAEGCKKTDTEKLYDCIVELYGYASDINPEEIVSHIADDGLNTWTRAWKNSFIKVAGEALGITRQLMKENYDGSESD